MLAGAAFGDAVEDVYGWEDDVVTSACSADPGTRGTRTASTSSGRSMSGFQHGAAVTAVPPPRTKAARS